MKKKTLILVTTLFMFSLLSPGFSFATSNPGQIYEGEIPLVYRNVTVYAPAVASTDAGYVGVISTITVTIQNSGSGRVFVDTLPLTQVDMQGSARLAVKVASALVKNDENCDVDPSTYDYFFVVRTTAPIIGGPSAGAIMTVATISLLENWTMDNKTIMTGMINPDASIGPIGGIPQKIDAAHSVGATRFLIPKGQGTYTEMSTGPIPIPITKSVADYAMDNYDMQAIEVAEIDEALEYFTGYTFSTTNSNGDISTTEYTESMEPLARHLLGNASEMLTDSWESFNNSGIPNYASTFHRDYVYDRVKIAEQTLGESQQWYDKNLYYTSTSKSFQSLIASRFVKYACEYDELQNSSYIADLLDTVGDLYDDANEEAKSAEINDFISLQCVGAAQRRASDAKIYLDSAESDYYNNRLIYFSDVLEFLYDISFVVERCNSVGWWIDIGSHFNASGSISNTTIENLALEYIGEAAQSAIYSGVILDEISSIYGASAEYLNNANSLIETARDDLEAGYPAAALFESLEALVKANLAIEIIGTETEEKIDSASERANSNIAKSRGQGIEPVLAVSYYEYAESLANESAFDSALMYYKYSGMIAGALSFTNISYGTASSRYVGIPEYTPPDHESIAVAFLVASSLIIGGIAGLGLGLFLRGVTSKKEEEKLSPRRIESKKIDEPQSLREYKKKYRDPYTSNGDMPRSIRDYYKKNK